MFADDDDDFALGVDSARVGRQDDLVAGPDDPSSWAEALRVLLYDPRLRATMGQAARRWVCENRTWDAAARTYIDLYARVLNIAGPDPSEDEGATRAS